jgi:hypothetical protein
MTRPRFLLFALALVFTALGYALAGTKKERAAERPVVIGRVEKVFVEDAHFTSKARIDTGAGVSSLSAEILEIKKPEKPGAPERVVFRMRDDADAPRTLEKPIVDWQSIKKKGEAGFIKRPVVVMDLCLAGKRVEARVNLANRSRFLYPVLVGRNTLKAGDFLINPAKKFTHKPLCPR